METLKERLLKVIDYRYKGRQINMANEFGINRTEVSRMINLKFITKVWLQRFAEYLPEIDLHWIITGKGEMIYKRELNLVDVEYSVVNTRFNDEKESEKRDILEIVIERGQKGQFINSTDTCE